MPATGQISPPTPPWLDQIQFISFYLFHTCDAPGFLYIEYAQPIAHKMLLSFVEFDIHGFIKTVFRPRWKRGSAHGRRSKRGKKYWVGIPEVNDLVAERIDSKRTLELPPTSKTLNYLIFFDDIAEVSANTAWIIDSAIGLPYQTIMGLIINNPNLCNDVGRFARSQVGQLTVPPIFGWFAMPITEFHYAFGCTSTTNIAMATVAGEFAVMFQIGIKNNENQDVEFNMRLCTPGGTHVYYELGRTGLGMGASMEICISAHIPKGQTVQWQIRSHIDNVTWINPKVGGMQIGD